MWRASLFERIHATLLLQIIYNNKTVKNKIILELDIISKQCRYVFTRYYYFILVTTII